MIMKHKNLRTSPEVSKRMSKVKLKRNEFEHRLSSELWKNGLRYRLNYKELPGSPDIAILKYQIAIFVDGEFWHGKDFEKNKKRLKNNKAYWIEKIKENIERDNKNDKELTKIGWIPIHFWSRDVKENLTECMQCILDFIEYQKDGRI